MAVNFGFLHRSRYFLEQLNYHHEAEWTPFQTHFFSEKKIWWRRESNPEVGICSQEH
jgi:hypothetical protein